MVKSQPSKLVMRVRFPLPALFFMKQMRRRDGAESAVYGVCAGIEGSPEDKED